MSAALSSVARIAYLSSDVLVDSQPNPPRTSLFAAHFTTLSESAKHKPLIISAPAGADSGSTLLHNPNASLVSYTASANAQILTRLVPHLPELSSQPVVLHLAINDDLSDVLILRSAVPFFFISTTSQQAHDNALLSSRLARTERKAVIHAFYVQDNSETVEEVAEDAIQPFLLSEKAKNVTVSLGNELPLDDLFKLYEAAALQTLSLTRRPFKSITASSVADPKTVIFVLGRNNLPVIEGVSIVHVSLINPLPHSRILNDIPASTRNVIVLEEIGRWNVKWFPLYLEVVSAIQTRDTAERPTIHSGVFGASGVIKAEEIQKLIQDAQTVSPSTRLSLGIAPSDSSNPNGAPHVPKHEQSYTKILDQIFGERLEISNSPSLVASKGEIATKPEFALGRVRGQLHQRAELVRAVQDLLEDSSIDKDLHSLLSKWVLAKDDGAKSRTLGNEIVSKIEKDRLKQVAAERVLSLRAHFPSLSRWIIGSDAWSYDIGSSGLHHTIASGLNINVLILDTLPYSARNSGDPNRRKRDIGLYAMNHGDVYVASVAVYSSYSQVLQSLVEADRFDGPSVILAYLPYASEDTPALQLLKETKLAVDAGYWPLYRWDPKKDQEGKEPFSLDSDAVKNDLRAFLDRQNHLSQLVLSNPKMAAELVSNLGDKVKEARKKLAIQSYDALLSNLDAPPLTILYASDGGAAEKIAKRLMNRAKARGLSATLATLDSMTLENLAEEEHVAIVTSTAGQGEPPQNARIFSKAINAAVLKGDKIFGNLKFTVFGMGDSHYWPRPEDAHYYNKPGKDLDAKLEQLGGERVADLGLGDDQDADGAQTGYAVWEPKLWKVLGVDSIEITEAEPDPITNEHIKAASQYLRGTIAEGLTDTSTGQLAPADTQLTKFHGIYQQDDRDIREERLNQGVEELFSFMIRVRMPGGVCRPDQWLAMDRIADEHGNQTFKITTRATFQFHGVIKKHLKPTIQAINAVLLDTIAACGDVNRNVICSSIQTKSMLHQQVYRQSVEISEHLLPRTTAYHEIWLDKHLVAGDAVKDYEPLYGEFYLPRKFKVAIAVPPVNDCDVFANDLGFIAIADHKGELAGFNVSIGGGMGVTHGNKKTYPRIGDVIGFCTVEQAKIVAEKVMLTQRDNGNRTDRKNARLKYTVDKMGVDGFKADVERRLGYKLQPARPYTFDSNIDEFGWVTGDDGKHHFTMFIENGRVQDEAGSNFKTGLRELAKVHKGTFRLTANQHLVISEIPDEELATVKEVLAKYKMDNLSQSALRQSSSSCVALPTCGLAMAESERYLPLLVDKIEKICEDAGLRNDSIVMRMTGCPNGCARPYLGEIAFVGKAPGTYSMLLGGGFHGQRLNKIYRETVTEPEILAILEPMIRRWAKERHEGEHFGDWTIRAGYIAPTTEGKLWYDRSGGEGEHREVAASA